MTDPEQRRLRRGAAQHGIAVLVFAMLALSGAGAVAPGLYGLAVPFIVTGIAGAGGAAVIAVSMWRLQRGAAGTETRVAPGARRESVPGAAAVERSLATQRTVRLAMAAAAVVALIAGVMLAPRGMDRGFVITVASGLAVALALFALFAGDRPRTADPRA